MIHLDWKTAGLAACLMAGCGGGDDGDTKPTGPEGNNNTVCVGKCDSAEPPARDYELDLNALNAIWGGTPVDAFWKFYSVDISMPNGLSITASTHIFPGELKAVPYHDDDGPHVVDAKGNIIYQGDIELAKMFKPGDIGYAIKHHRPSRRTLDFGSLAGAGADGLKEDMKLQDTHIELIIGVRRPLGGPGGEMVNGVISLNNPQTYQDGRFGSANYSMIFVEPQLPDYTPAGMVRPFEDNIRTMMLAFNAVSKFPGDYNGGDPLAAYNPDKVREHVRQMVVAIAGEGLAQDDARAFFTKQEHMIYCAELAHVSTSAGLLVPLNQTGLVESGLVDQDTYDRFAQIVADHNDGKSTPFTELNDNNLARYVDATMAPGDLKPLPAYSNNEEESKRIAFRPLTMAEIVAGFLRTHIPRDNPALGEKAAPIQAAVLTAMQPGLYEAMGMDDDLFHSMVTRADREIASLSEDLDDPALSAARRISTEELLENWKVRRGEAQAQLDGMAQKRAIVDGLFQKVIGVVGTEWADYDEFRTQLAPLMAQARQLTGPRDNTGTGYFVPPSALHLVALGCVEDDRCGGLISLNYLAHGVHMSGVVVQNVPPAPAPTAVVAMHGVIPNPNSDNNGDGSVDALKDELIEISNVGDAAADLSYWTLSDKVKERFEFPAGTMLAPGDAILVLGGGDVSAPNFAANGLGLNNNGDILTLRNENGDTVHEVSWGKTIPGATYPIPNP